MPARLNLVNWLEIITLAPDRKTMFTVLRIDTHGASFQGRSKREKFKRPDRHSATLNELVKP
jgi:hypothetical protein